MPILEDLVYYGMAYEVTEIKGGGIWYACIENMEGLSIDKRLDQLAVYHKAHASTDEKTARV